MSPFTSRLNAMTGKNHSSDTHPVLTKIDPSCEITKEATNIDMLVIIAVTCLQHLKQSQNVVDFSVSLFIFIVFININTCNTKTVVLSCLKYIDPKLHFNIRTNVLMCDLWILCDLNFEKKMFF